MAARVLSVDLLLRRLCREDEEPAVRLERADEKGKEGGGGLSDAGRGLDEEMLALCGGARDGGSHLALAGPEACVREDERRGLGGFRLGEGPFLEERLQEHPRAVHEVLEGLLGLVRHVEKLRRARLDVREDEAPVNGPPFGNGHCLHVPAELELKRSRRGDPGSFARSSAKCRDLTSSTTTRPPSSKRPSRRPSSTAVKSSTV